jgi:hypothetical protein
MKWILGIIGVIVLSVNLYSQEIEFKIYNSESLTPCSYVHVIINSNLFVSDVNGKVNLPESTLLNEDTIIFSSIGFKTKKINGQNIKKFDTIYLVQKINQIDEVIVKPTNRKKKIKKIGHWKNIGPYGTQLVPEETAGVYLYPTKERCQIKDINIYIKGYLSFKQLMKVKILSFNTDSLTVLSNILLDDVYFETPEKEGWVTVDLTDFNIYIPKKGVLVGIEPLLLNQTVGKIKEYGTKKELLIKYPFIGYTCRKSHIESYQYYSFSQKWHKKQGACGNHLIYINVIEYK